MAKESKGEAVKRLTIDNGLLTNRADALSTVLDGLLGQYSVALKRMPAEAGEVFKAYFAADMAAGKLALSAFEATDLRALAAQLTEDGWVQPDAEANGNRESWEVVIDDLIPHAATPAAEAMLADMRTRVRGGFGPQVQPHNGRDALWDLYKAQLDSVVYAMQMVQENPNEEWPRQVYFQHVQMALNSRRRLLTEQYTKAVKNDPGVLARAIAEKGTPVATIEEAT